MSRVSANAWDHPLRIVKKKKKLDFGKSGLLRGGDRQNVKGLELGDCIQSVSCIFQETTAYFRLIVYIEIYIYIDIYLARRKSQQRYVLCF